MLLRPATLAPGTLCRRMHLLRPVQLHVQYKLVWYDTYMHVQYNSHTPTYWASYCILQVVIIHVQVRITIIYNRHHLSDQCSIGGHYAFLLDGLDWLKSSHHCLEYHIDWTLTNPLRNITHHPESFSQERKAISFLAKFLCFFLNSLIGARGTYSTDAFDLSFPTPLPPVSNSPPTFSHSEQHSRHHSVSALSLSQWAHTSTDFDCSQRVDPNRSRPLIQSRN